MLTYMFLYATFFFSLCFISPFLLCPFSHIVYLSVSFVYFCFFFLFAPVFDFRSIINQKSALFRTSNFKVTCILCMRAHHWTGMETTRLPWQVVRTCMYPKKRARANEIKRDKRKKNMYVYKRDAPPLHKPPFRSRIRHLLKETKISFFLFLSLPPHSYPNFAL